MTAGGGRRTRPGSPWRAPRGGPVEDWLASLVEEAFAATLPDLGASVDAVDVAVGSKLGELRAHLSFPGQPPDRAVWRRLPGALSEHPAVQRVVPMPPTVHVTLAPGVLESGVARVAGAPAALPGRPDAPGVAVVFCSPNTNKPLHIGHLRACFLGMAISRLFEATGVPVRNSQMLSNFGVHMCQALAVHDGVTDPASAGTKPDWFVGDLYRAYHRALESAPDHGCHGAECAAPAGERPCLRCRPLHLLRRMAEGDAELLAAGRRLGEWAIEGITATQARVGATYDSGLRESETLALGVATLERAVAEGVCARRADGSIYIDIHSTGATELTLLRRDGTSLVFSMLLAIYLSRAERYPGWRVVELTGEQWRAGRTAMYELLRRLGRSELADATEGVFFGMVKSGGAVMRSREGTVLQADALLDRTRARVASEAEGLGWCGLHPSRHDRLGVSLLKYHVLRFPRADGFDFGEDTMWADATTRLGAVRRALALAEGAGKGIGRSDAGKPDRELRPLALALSRHTAVARRALDGRDPAVLVRYVDELAERGLSSLRRADPALCAAFARVLRASLALLDVDPVMPDG